MFPPTMHALHAEHSAGDCCVSHRSRPTQRTRKLLPPQDTVISIYVVVNLHLPRCVKHLLHLSEKLDNNR